MTSADQEMFANIKNNGLGEFDRVMPQYLDKTNPLYNQSNTDRLYIQFKRLKNETVNKLATPLSDSERANYETLLKELDVRTAKLEPIVSNGLAGGKRRNYKKTRRCGKKTRRCGKKTTSRCK